jgi:lysyl-tRNA synthetase class I
MTNSCSPSSSRWARRTGSSHSASWFSALYEVLMGASHGPRFGGFIALYGIEETRALIADGLAGKLTAD